MSDLPVWALFVDNDKPMRNNSKYHCFDGEYSLCGKYQMDTRDYDTSAESGHILQNPQFACKKCRNKWIKKFDIL